MTGPEGNQDNPHEDGLPEDEHYIADSDELALDDEERLPWLESGDYDDEEDGYDTGKLIGIFLAGLLVIAGILFALWYFGNRGPDPELVADGSTIEAPAGDFKDRPEDAGGREMPGTGDVAPSVGEGQTREGRLATDGAGNGANGAGTAAGAAGSATAAGAGAASGSGSAGETPGPSVDALSSSDQGSSSNGVGVQVGAYSSRASAVEGWGKLRSQTDALQGVKYRVQQGTADIGTVYRLQAVAANAAAANSLCAKLKADGIACQVKN